MPVAKMQFDSSENAVPGIRFYALDYTINCITSE
jgi:hypothetical protein